MKTQQNRQAGFSLLPVALSVAVMAALAAQLLPLSSRLQAYTFRTATVAGINELAAAAKVFYIHPDNHNAWPSDPETLVEGDYLAGFENRNGFGYPYEFQVIGDTLTIKTIVRDTIQAQEVAANFGGLAVVDGPQVSVSWSIPGAEASHEALIPRDGSRDVFGKLVHRAGGNAGIALNDNDIESVRLVNASGTLRVRNPNNLGLIDADNGAIDLLTVNDIRITP
jgi:hypothetical protein